MPDRRTPLLACALVVAILAVYAPVLDSAFVNYDDDIYVTERPEVLAGLSREGVVWAATTFQGANWFPLTRLSWMLDATLFGASARGFHATGLALHALNTVLLFLALLRLTGARGPSAFVAGVFALHPLHVESVAWVASRKDLVSGLFFMLALLAHERVARAGRRAGWLVLLFALTALGLMAKPMLVTLPCVLLLLDEWPLRRLRRDDGGWDPGRIGRAVAEKLPLLALAAAASAVTVAAQRAGGALQGLERYPLGLRIANALDAYRAYLVDAVWPHGLAVFYPYPRDVDPNRIVVDVALLGVLTILSLRSLRRWPVAAVGWLWFVGMLVPVIGLVQVGQAAYADRYTYLPLIGLSLPVAFGAREVGLRWPVVAPALRNAGVAALALLAFSSAVQVRQWHDSETLFRHALAVTSGNHVAHINLGHALVRQGRLAEAEDQLTQAIAIEPDAANARGLRGEVRLLTHQLGPAREDLEGALRLEPESTRWRTGLARVLVEQEQWAPAERLLTEVVEREPDSAQAQALLGFVQVSTGRPGAAAASYRIALERPGDLERVLGRSGLASVHAQLAAALAALHLPLAAVQALDDAIRLDPERAELHGQRARLLETAGQDAAAVASYREAIRLGDASLPVLNNLAWLLATSNRPNVRAPVQAVALARRAVAGGGASDPGVLDTLAVAYAASGQREQALAAGRRALALAEAQKRDDLAESIRQRLAEWSAAPTS